MAHARGADRTSGCVGQIRRPLLPSAWSLGFCWGLLIACIPLIDFLARPPREGLAEYNFQLIREAPPIASAIIPILLILSAVPALLAAWRCGIDFRKGGFYPALALSMVLIVAASLMGQPPAALVYIVLVAYCFLLATIINTLASDADDVICGLLSGVAIGIGAAMVLMLRDGNYSYGRLMGRSGPNYWGMTAMATFFVAFAIRNAFLKAAVAMLALLVVYLCQSRGAMMAVAGGGGIIWLLAVYHANRLQRLLLVAGTAVIVILVVLSLSDFIMAKLLLTDDRGRGIGSGGTGRFAAWAEAFELFAQSPWLGVGYRQHERFITAASSAHNAYLAVLAELGLSGFVIYLGLMLGGAVMAFRKALHAASGFRFAVAGLIVGFMLVGMVERVGIATGNALSLTVIFASAWAFSRDRGVVAVSRVRRTRRRRLGAVPSLVPATEPAGWRRSIPSPSLRASSLRT